MKIMKLVLKLVNLNDFYSPMNNYSIGNNQYNMHYHEAGEFEFQMQIGSVKYPQTQIRSHTEAYYQLKMFRYSI